MAKGIEGNKVRTITCIACGKTVTKRMPPGRKYCSIDCYRTSPRPQKRSGKMKRCEICDSQFYVPKSRVEEARFCSRKCTNEWQGRNKTSHTCKMCGKDFRWSPSRSKSGNYNITYCSLDCRDIDPERKEMLLELNAVQQLGKMTKLERAGYEMLDKCGVEYDPQRVFAGKFTPDAVIPSARLVVQFDGDYWHDKAGNSTEPRIIKRVNADHSQDAYIRACGWEVIRFWESDLKQDQLKCEERLMEYLHRPLGAEPERNPLDPR